MIILFESYSYKSSLLLSLLPDAFIRELPGNQVQVTHVGYLGPKPSVIGDQAIVILPKVFLNEKNKVFDIYTPEEFIELSTLPKLREQLRQSGGLDFLFRVSVWLFQAINHFARRNTGSNLIDQSELHCVLRKGDPGRSALEIIQSLIRFYHEHQSLLTFIKKYNVSQKGTISWSRTISKQTPVIQKGQVIYDQPVGKQKFVNYDEELLRIFISTLVDFKTEYGLRFEINSLFQPLAKPEFERFKQAPTRRLKQIRGQYFTDQLIRLWNLLFMYYEQTEQQKSYHSRQERLLVRDFNIVFEDMIDFLLSDPPSSRQPKRLKYQHDGKIVDHLYEFNSLIDPKDSIFHIGDSKYYKSGGQVGSHSIYKQYTYARNIIFENISLTNSAKLPTPLRYRDELTEGYNPTPNFFISATVDEKLRFGNPNLQFNKYYSPSYHFSDRLFDRDTLLLQHYDINFLYVLAAYVIPRSGEIGAFRTRTQQEFRNRLIYYLKEHYSFFQVRPKSGDIESFITAHFRYLIGKMYRPSDFKKKVLVAVPIGQEQELIRYLDLDASITPWDLL